MNNMARTTRYFYQIGAVSTVVADDLHRTIFRYSGAALAEHERGNHLLASDRDGSALIAHDGISVAHQSFSPYGYSPYTIAATAYNGEVEDRYSKLYLLGIGNHRAYSSKLMRFLGSDEKSPIGEGGINSYGYCGANPVNFHDPSGAVPIPKRPPSQSIFGTPIKKPRPPSQIERIVREFNTWAAKPAGKKALASSMGDPRAEKLISMYTDAFQGQLKKAHKTSAGSRSRQVKELDIYILQEEQYHEKQLQKLMSAQTIDNLTSTFKKALPRKDLVERYYEKKRSSSDRLTLAEHVRDLIRI